MSEKKLLPCPFCGGEAKILYNRLRCGNYVSGGTFRVHCKNCGITTEGKKDRNKSIELWNTRVPMQKIVERLNNNFRKVMNDEDLEWNRAIDKAIEIVTEEGM